MKVMIAFKRTQRPDQKWYYKAMSKCVQLWTKSPYFHVGIVIDGHWITSDTDVGVIVEQFKPDDTYDYFLLDLGENACASRATMEKYVNDQKSSGYDWVGILFSEFLNLRWESRSKWYCSELVVKILQILGQYDAITSSTLISPADLYKILEKKLMITYTDK